MDTEMEVTTMTAREEQIAYYALCDRAKAGGVDTSLDTNPALDTVEKLREAVKR